VLVDRLVIGVAINRDKGPLFSLEERVAMIEAESAAPIARPGPRSSPIRSRTC
jgi:pantetheine-phosphate adenylyltransferase